MLSLKQGVVAIRIDQDTIIVDTNSGKYFAANTVAYEMIVALLNNQSDDDAVQSLITFIDADQQTLKQDLSTVRARLAELELSA